MYNGRDNTKKLCGFISIVVPQKNVLKKLMLKPSINQGVSIRVALIIKKEILLVVTT